ncbi:hypothetical protein [Sporomusa aerivorans]|uniref:hypothetical protein n=1 Tax=Sporomusa aerivorans TaxID=204936 RepID=UPI00352A88D6
MPTWSHIPVAVIIGAGAAIVAAIIIAARELGDWRAIRLQLVVNNRNHNQRRFESD